MVNAALVTTLYLVSITRCNEVEHSSLRWPTACACGSPFNSIHHFTEQRHALNSLADISSVHLSGVAAFGTRGCGVGCCARGTKAAILLASVAIASLMSVAAVWALRRALGEVVALLWPPGIFAGLSGPGYS